VTSESVEPGRPPVRASDGDRQRVADLLREHTTAGRLTMEEYEQRVDVAYAARTVAELRPLLVDLPVPLDDVLPLATALPPPAPAGPGWSKPPAQASGPRWTMLLVAVALLVGFVLLMTRGFFFWPLLIGGFFVFGGGRHRHRHHHRW
jgi:hypothetical protein